MSTREFTAALYRDSSPSYVQERMLANLTEAHEKLAEIVNKIGYGIECAWAIQAKVAIEATLGALDALRS